VKNLKSQNQVLTLENQELKEGHPPQNDDTLSSRREGKLETPQPLKAQLTRLSTINEVLSKQQTRKNQQQMGELELDQPLDILEEEFGTKIKDQRRKSHMIPGI
jgi:hypothetical protein